MCLGIGKALVWDLIVGVRHIDSSSNYSQPFLHLLRQTRPQFVRLLPVASVSANADKLDQVDLEWLAAVSHGLTEKRCLFAQGIQRRRRVPLSETESNVAPL